MAVLYMLIALAFAVVGAAVWAFIWAVDHDQFEDMDAPAVRMLDGPEADETQR